MKKLVNITIGSVVFSVEEDAYKTLASYLDAIRGHFQDSDSQEEIVDDIELSIAEKFSKKKVAVIRSKDVDAIISDMGTIKDFKEMGEEDIEIRSDEHSRKKKLYRNVDDQVIAGVASGIAAYFGIDPVFVRLAFVASIFFSGIGVFVYLVLWLVMPAAETMSQKLEMQGDPVTLHELEKMVKDKLPDDVQERKSAFIRVLKIPFAFLRGVLNFLGVALRNIGPVIRIGFGVVVLAISIGITVGMAIAVTGFHFSVNSGLFELPVHEFLSGAQYALGLVSIYTLLLIPGVVGVVLGISVLKKENKFNVVMVSALGLIWMGALFGVGHIASSIVPQYQSYVDNMPSTSELYELDIFTAVEVATGDNVLIKEGEEYQVSVSGKEVSVNQLTFEVHNGILMIHNVHENRICIGCFNQKVDIVITTPTLDEIIATHGTSVVVERFDVETFNSEFKYSATGEIDIVADRLNLYASHGSDVMVKGDVDEFIAEFKYSATGDIDIVANRINLYMSHSSDVTVNGEGDELIAEIFYSSTLDASHLESLKASLQIAYSSDAVIGTTETLNVIAEHSSHLMYDGGPDLTEDVSSSSSVRKTF